MSTTDADKEVLTKRFLEIFGTKDHPLYDKFLNDLTGERSLNAVLTDLQEAQRSRDGQSKSDDPRLYIASL